MEIDWIMAICCLLPTLPLSQGCTEKYDTCRDFEVLTAENNLSVTSEPGSTITKARGVSSNLTGTNATATYRLVGQEPFRLDVLQFSCENVHTLILRFVFHEQPLLEAVEVSPVHHSPHKIVVTMETNPVAKLVVTATPKDSAVKTQFRLIELCACKAGPQRTCSVGETPRNLSDFDISLNGSVDVNIVSYTMQGTVERPGHTFISSTLGEPFIVDLVLKPQEDFSPKLILFRLTNMKEMLFQWHQRVGEWFWDTWVIDNLERDLWLPLSPLDGIRVKALRIIAVGWHNHKHAGFTIDRLDVCALPPLATTNPTTPTSTSGIPMIIDQIPNPGESVPLASDLENPCTIQSRAVGQFYFSHPRNPRLFIQCDSNTPHVLACATGLVWSTVFSTCVNAGFHP